MEDYVGNIKSIVLDKIKVKVHNVVSRSVIENSKIDVVDMLGDNIVYALTTYLLGKKHVIDVGVPNSWYDHLKYTVNKRWKTNFRVVYRTINTSTTYICPHLNYTEKPTVCIHWLEENDGTNI